MKLLAGALAAWLLLAVLSAARAQTSQPLPRVVELKASEGTPLKAAYFVANMSGPGVLLPTQLLDRLAGDWVLKGVLGGKKTVHHVEAAWVLNREYLRLHEVSREKKANREPAYEAIVFISWDAKAQEYRCLWLDNTEGGGLSVPTARAKREEHAIPFVFGVSGGALHTTFTYDRTSDTWNWTIDDVKDGKTERFADLTLNRRE